MLDRKAKQVKALHKALRALDKMEDRERFLRPYGLQAEEDFTWQKMRQEYLEAIKELIAIENGEDKNDA